MGFRFRKSFKVAPGVRLNVGKKGISTTIGTNGAKITVGSNGTRVTTGIPGTGLSYTKKIDNKQSPQNIESIDNKQTNIVAEKLTAFSETHKEKQKEHLDNIKQNAFYKEDMFIITMIVLFYPLGIFLMYNYSKNLRKYRFIINFLPILAVSLLNQTLSGILGLFLPFIFIPIFTIGFFYCLYKTKYFMPYAVSVIICCINFLIWVFRFI